MDILNINFWFYSYEAWFIFAVILLFVELFDGSKLFFLPMGVSAGIVGSFLFLAEKNILPSVMIPSSWYIVLFVWSVFAVIVSLVLKQYQKKQDTDDGDINQY